MRKATRGLSAHAKTRGLNGRLINAVAPLGWRNRTDHNTEHRPEAKSRTVACCSCPAGQSPAPRGLVSVQTLLSVNYLLYINPAFLCKQTQAYLCCRLCVASAFLWVPRAAELPAMRPRRGSTDGLVVRKNSAPRAGQQLATASSAASSPWQAPGDVLDPILQRLLASGEDGARWVGGTPPAPCAGACERWRWRGSVPLIRASPAAPALPCVMCSKRLAALNLATLAPACSCAWRATSALPGALLPWTSCLLTPPSPSRRWRSESVHAARGLGGVVGLWACRR